MVYTVSSWLKAACSSALRLPASSASSVTWNTYVPAMEKVSESNWAISASSAFPLSLLWSGKAVSTLTPWGAETAWSVKENSPPSRSKALPVLGSTALKAEGAAATLVGVKKLVRRMLVSKQSDPSSKATSTTCRPPSVESVTLTLTV